MLAAVLTAGNVNDTPMLSSTLDEIRVPRQGPGRPRTRPDRLLADKGYPSRANRAWLAERGIKATIPDKADQAAGLRRSIRRSTRGATWSNAASTTSNAGEG